MTLILANDTRWVMSERDGMLELVEQRHETFPEVESSEENK
jgi:hypothetical protein